MILFLCYLYHGIIARFLIEEIEEIVSDVISNMNKSKNAADPDSAVLTDSYGKSTPYSSLADVIVIFL